MSGTFGEGTQYRLQVCPTTAFASILQHEAVVYNGVDFQIDKHDASAGVTYLYAGLVYTGWPYTEAIGFQNVPYAGTSMSVPTLTNWLTVGRQCRHHGIAAEDIVAGNFVMLTDFADGATQQHDGMLSPSDTAGPTAAQMYQTIGIAEEAGNMAVAHDVHTWRWNTGDYADHTAFVVYLWK